MELRSVCLPSMVCDAGFGFVIIGGWVLGVLMRVVLLFLLCIGSCVCAYRFVWCGCFSCLVLVVRVNSVVVITRYS